MSRYEVVSYKHYGRCYRMFNDKIELLITAELGPRIIRFGFIGGENEFAEVDPCPLQSPGTVPGVFMAGIVFGMRRKT